MAKARTRKATTRRNPPAMSNRSLGQFLDNYARIVGVDDDARDGMTWHARFDAPVVAFPAELVDSLRAEWRGLSPETRKVLRGKRGGTILTVRTGPGGTGRDFTVLHYATKKELVDAWRERAAGAEIDDDEDEGAGAVDVAPHVEVWEERDRLHISLYKGEKEIADWWDDDARQMFEDGFFERRRLEESVIEYAMSMGLL